MTDARLVLPALAAWSGALAALVGLSAIEAIGSRHLVAIWLLPVVGLCALITGWFLRRQPASMVSVVAAAIAVCACAAQVAAWSAPALQEAHNSSVEVTGTVTGPARDSLGVSYVPVTTSHISRVESSTKIEVPITITLPRFTAVPEPGTAVTVTGRFRPAGGSFTAAAYLDADDDGFTIQGSPSLVQQAAQRVRDSLQASLPAAPEGGSALVAGLAIGDEQQMSPELVEQMRMSGLSHLTAVSGGNVAIVVGAIAAIAWLLRLPMLARIAASLVTLGFYVIVVHPQPSVLRAGVMGAVVVVSLLVGGRTPGPSILATAVLVLVILSPSLAASWGFALSVAATAGILLLAPIAQERIEASSLGERAPPALILAITVTLAAQVATAPVLLAMGAYVGIAAIPANVLAMPLVPLITITGLAAALVGAVPGGQLPAQFLAWVGAWAGEWIARVAGVFADVDFLRIHGSPAIAAVFVIVSATVVIAWRITARPRWMHARLYVVGVGLAAAMAASLWWLFPPNNRTWPPTGWVVTQCDVGQGDGLVIAPAGDAGAVVVDTGVSARVIDTCLSDLGIDHISALILTHFHADHVSGLTGVVDGRRVDAVFATVFDEPAEQFEGVVYELERRNMQLRRLTAGAEIRIGDGRYRVLWPRRIITTGQVSDGSVANNASVVLDARVHGVRVLLTGDIEPPAQAAILGERGDFDIAKVPHHGSRHQHPRFATWANAEIALVSVGRDNRFGHPAAETLEAWSESGAMVLRTDHSGDIALVKNDDGTFAVTTRHDMLSTP